MTAPALDPQLLLDLPLFSGLQPDELAELEGQLATEEHPRGSHVFHRGAPGDSLYVVLTGQVALEIRDGDRVEEMLALAGPGDWFGEVALLTLGPRTADARVTIDARLLRISRAGWAALSLHAPQLFARLCERLSRNLRAMNEPRRARRAVVACGDAGSGGASPGGGGGEGRDGAGISWLPELARSLQRQFPAREVHVLALDGTACSNAAGPAVCPVDRRALEQAISRSVAADALFLLAGGALEGLADRVLVRQGAAEWRLEPGRGRRAAESIRGATPRDALDRVARHLAGGTVGLALGAGGAFGFAHLGLLCALAAAGIPVDYVAGSSMGAIIGGFVAAGVPATRMVEFAKTVAARFYRILLRDLNLTGPTLLRGGAVMRVVAEVEEVRRVTFEQLQIPFVAVAMDLATGEEVLLDTGPLLDAVRPSFAMPGIFPPCAVGGRTMIDGAMVNPVPVDVARALGADFVIASHVMPPLLPVALDPVGSLLGRTRRFAALLPLWRLENWLTTLDVSLRSFQALWFRLSSASAMRADTVVRPDLRHFWFLEFNSAAPIIEAGRLCAEASVAQLRALLSERTGLATAPPV